MHDQNDAPQDDRVEENYSDDLLDPDDRDDYNDQLSPHLLAQGDQQRPEEDNA